MLNLEKRSLFQFAALYIISISLFLIAISVIYYNYQKNIFLDTRRTSMQIYAERLANSVSDCETKHEIEESYAEDRRFSIALYDSHKKPIIVNIHRSVNLKKTFFHEGDKLYLIDRIDNPTYGFLYLVIEAKDISEELHHTQTSIYIFLLSSFIFISIIGYFLSKLFLRPLRNYISRIDNFIKDTTHELNTPLSAILMSIETLPIETLPPTIQKKINRISVAAKTISTLYKDLSFLTLYQKMVNNNQIFSLDDLIKERVEFFETIAEVKHITFSLELTPLLISMDKEKMVRIIDNLVSNAIKYNYKNGSITIQIIEHHLMIHDTGVGIPTDKLQDIFRRYTRFDEANGGFGIGLNIVSLICEEYALPILVDSSLGKGTTFTLDLNNILYHDYKTHSKHS